VLARQLVQQRTNILGVVVGDLGQPFFAEMASSSSGMLPRELYGDVLQHRGHSESGDRRGGKPSSNIESRASVS